MSRSRPRAEALVKLVMMIGVMVILVKLVLPLHYTKWFMKMIVVIVVVAVMIVTITHCDQACSWTPYCVRGCVIVQYSGNATERG